MPNHRSTRRPRSVDSVSVSLFSFPLLNERDYHEIAGSLYSVSRVERQVVEPGVWVAVLDIIDSQTEERCVGGRVIKGRHGVF